MIIIKIVSFTLIALFFYLFLKDTKQGLSIYVVLVAGVAILLFMTPYIKEIIMFIQDIATKANIDLLYIEVVMKILAISYLASFCSEICKDAGANSLASKVEFSGKVFILLLAVPILRAVLDAIIKIV